MTMPFKVEDRVLEDGIVVLTVSGELDEATADKLRQPLDRAIGSGVRGTMIDLSDCEFIDSTGLAVIVHAWRQCNGRNGSQPGLALCCPDREVKRLLELTGIAEQVGLHHSREDALAALRG